MMKNLEQLLILERKIALFDRLLERGIVTEEEHDTMVAAVSDVIREGLGVAPRRTMRDPKKDKPQPPENYRRPLW